MDLSLSKSVMDLMFLGRSSIILVPFFQKLYHQMSWISHIFFREIFWLWTKIWLNDLTMKKDFRSCNDYIVLICIFSLALKISPTIEILSTFADGHGHFCVHVFKGFSNILLQYEPKQFSETYCIHGYFRDGFIFVNFASQSSRKFPLQVMKTSQKLWNKVLTNFPT